MPQLSIRRMADACRDRWAKATDESFVYSPDQWRAFGTPPAFLANALLLAEVTSQPYRRTLFACVAKGLEEFSVYLAFIVDHPARKIPPGKVKSLQAMQRRYFAYCLTQLAELGMELGGILMTMKADSLDMESKLHVRDLLEHGPERCLTSPLFTDAERGLWAAVVSHQPNAWDELRAHLVEAYHLPFTSMLAS